MVSFPSQVQQPLAITALIVFFVAYAFVISEEFIEMRKSKPVVLASGIMWVLVGIIGIQLNLSEAVTRAFRVTLLEYAELMLFLLVAMSYINAMEERLVFRVLQAKLLAKRLSYRQLFWLTGIFAFFISPIADNLTTALIVCAVVLALAAEQKKFIGLACINIVIAANAGGAFSPFGDITTLMVWQAEKVKFVEFFHLFIPAVVNFLVPALCMHFAVPVGQAPLVEECIALKAGAKGIVVLFILTILTTVLLQHYLHLPPVAGMMLGFGYLKLFGFFLKKSFNANQIEPCAIENKKIPFDVFQNMKKIEWDTLLFFYGVMMCVGALAMLGYLASVSNFLYHQLGQGLSPAMHAFPANILVGLFSAVIDNIPVMYAVLNMDPGMSTGQWLLVTLTAGVGGSLFSIGSAAGVALMGQSHGNYTFFSHFKWFFAIFLGFIASIAVHVYLNWHLF